MADAWAVRLGVTAQDCAEQIGAAAGTAGLILVLWSFYSPDVDAKAAELAAVRAGCTPPRNPSTCWTWAGTWPRSARARPPSWPWCGRCATAPTWLLTGGCHYTCRFCQTPFMSGGRFRHRPVESVRHHVRKIVGYGLRDVRFITPTSLSYGSAGAEPDLDAVEELLAGVRDAVRIAAEHGFRPNVDFIFGMPGVHPAGHDAGAAPAGAAGGFLWALAQAGRARGPAGRDGPGLPAAHPAAAH